MCWVEQEDGRGEWEEGEEVVEGEGKCGREE